MMYKVLADSVVVTHLLFIVFVILGGLLVLRWRWIIWLHIPAVFWGTAVAAFGWYCPLTPLENWLRSLSHDPTYTSGFIEHYLLPIIYPTGLTRELQFIFAAVVVIVNSIVYLWVWHRFRRRNKSSTGTR